ncbi:hypothetical protein M5J14_10155 [Lysinibacillus sp. OL1_EC]|uniref:hypothetical protein n=1 Tax=unclassified Lysinibacillus TaxID=2636778 RepID=UPI00103DB502|nr:MULTISPECIES: hypothetical protein [unclassified Lysinibacillus]MCM0624881.1 hypothetical protein [Lysinibacillus sp. OL1_EC]TBV87707.1 hypothetical protein EW028_11480 [Lysinibacillus sp. OL1]
MNENICVLNRQNVMVYRKESETVLKTSYKSFKFSTSDDKHLKLLDLLNDSIIGIPLEMVNDEDKKLIKMLSKNGVLLVYRKGGIVDKCKSLKWFQILSQYLPPDFDLEIVCKEIMNTTIVLRNSLNDKIPKIKEIFSEFDMSLVLTDQKFSNNNKLCVLTDNELDPNQDCGILIQKFNQGISGTVLKDLYYEPLDNDLSRMIKIFSPLYILIYTIKKLAGFGSNTFYMNEVGKFTENDVQHHIVNVVSTSQSPLVLQEQQKDIERIEKFEMLIQNKYLKMKIANQYTEYSDLFQSGLSTYAIIDEFLNKEYVIAGLNFEKSAVEAIKYAVRLHFENVSGGKWLITENENYFLDKILLLVNSLPEKGIFTKLSGAIMNNLKVFRSYGAFLDNIEIYIEKFEKSNSYKVYLKDNDGKMFGDSKKCIDLSKKIEETILNYLLHYHNDLGSKVKTPYSFYDKNTTSQNDCENLREIPYVSSRLFIENALKLFKENDIRYEEFAWDREFELQSLNLCARRIDVGSYGG